MELENKSVTDRAVARGVPKEAHTQRYLQLKRFIATNMMQWYHVEES